MIPDAQQPTDERDIVFHDLINWWNLAKGRCMTPQCNKKLVWGNYGKKTPRKHVWMLQRSKIKDQMCGDQRRPHFASNIIAV
eukprot:7123046-Prymnesium_polylepis.1